MQHDQHLLTISYTTNIHGYLDAVMAQDARGY